MTSPAPEDLDQLFDESALSTRRAEAEARFRDLSSDQIKFLKKKMKNDLFFLGSSLGYNLLSPRLHGHYAGWLQKRRGWQYSLQLMPRGHYKTTLATILDLIQMALPVECSDYPYSLGVNGKFLVMHEVRETAAKILFEITKAFTHKDVMLAFFPECIPKKNEQRINKWELELPRTEHHKEATFSTGSSGGDATSARCGSRARRATSCSRPSPARDGSIRGISWRPTARSWPEPETPSR